MSYDTTPNSVFFMLQDTAGSSINITITKQSNNFFNVYSSNNLIKCVDCGKFISVHANQCINCGCPLYHTVLSYFNSLINNQISTPNTNTHCCDF